MLKFDYKRFVSLMRWTLTIDRRHHIKTLASWTIILTLMFLFFTCAVNFNNDADGLRPYQSCGVMVIVMVVAIVTMGPAYMFTSMKGRHDDRRLLMLPASNLEKYVTRYLCWVLMLPICAVALVCADVVQWVVNMLAGHENTIFVVQWLADMPHRLPLIFGPVPSGLRHLFVALATVTLWIHSLYAVGATLFRSHKYNWVLTSVAIIAGIMLLSYAQGSWGEINIFWWNRVGWFDGLFVALSVFNFWLSYRQFCRTQVIGRFVNF